MSFADRWNAKAEIAYPFIDEDIFEEKFRQLAELNAELDMDSRKNEIVDDAEKHGWRSTTKDLQQRMTLIDR